MSSPDMVTVWYSICGSQEQNTREVLRPLRLPTSKLSFLKFDIAKILAEQFNGPAICLTETERNEAAAAVCTSGASIYSW